MALINHIKREINAKIVYYGREGAGKGATLQYLYDRIKPTLRGELKTVPASGDSLLFFDFSPFDHPVFGGYRIRFHMYSLIGAVTNPAAWKMTLKGADGVVIVADASPESVPANRECISNLRGFLKAYGVGLHDIPCVLQCNRSGNGGQYSEAGIAAELDAADMRVCFSETGSGKGVLDALSQISREIMTRIGQNEALQPGERNGMPGLEQPAEETAGLTASENDEGYLNTDPVQSMTAGSSLCAKNLPSDEDGGGQLWVRHIDGGVSWSDGTVRIPLEISLAGDVRRLVLTVAIEQE